MSNTKIPKTLVDVFLSYRKALEQLVRKIVPGADVEDIVQETFIRAHQAEVDRRLEYPKAFMYKTARNLALNFIAKKQHSCTSALEDFSDSDVYSNEYYYQEGFESKEKFRLFCAAVRELPQQSRKAFVMKRVFGYTIREISEALDISESTTEKHIAAGVVRCAIFLENKGYSVNRRAKHPLKNNSKNNQANMQTIKKV